MSPLWQAYLIGLGTGLLIVAVPAWWAIRHLIARIERLEHWSRWWARRPTTTRP